VEELEVGHFQSPEVHNEFTLSPGPFPTLNSIRKGTRSLSIILDKLPTIENMLPYDEHLYLTWMYLDDRTAHGFP